MRLFITHAGLRSTEESLAAHVPMVCIPFFVDQYWNCRQVDKLKAGKRLYLKDVTEETFMSTVREVLEDERCVVEFRGIFIFTSVSVTRGERRRLEKSCWINRSRRSKRQFGGSSTCFGTTGRTI